jgi:peptidoglycan/xylan/chitin deacetylase (PgdA/CDA1 family)
MPRFIQRLYPERIWAFSHVKDSVFLTFDDGPIPEITPWVLDELKKHNAKATFFCIGENVKTHSEIFQRILAEGHSVGNHTFNHLNGWKTSISEYIENIEKAKKQMHNSEFRIQNSELLFRAPYGKITSKQAKTLQNKGFKIVMWDVLSYDYDGSVSEEKCLKNVLNNIKPGSIVVFHDSLKAEKNLRYVLPKVLEFLNENKLSASTINIIP